MLVVYLMSAVCLAMSIPGCFLPLMEVVSLTFGSRTLQSVIWLFWKRNTSEMNTVEDEMWRKVMPISRTLVAVICQSSLAFGVLISDLVWRCRMSVPLLFAQTGETLRYATYLSSVATNGRRILHLEPHCRTTGGCMGSQVKKRGIISIAFSVQILSRKRIKKADADDNIKRQPHRTR